MKKLLLNFSLLFISICLNAQVVPNLDWAQYLGTKGTKNSFASAIDADNNAFIVGYAQGSSKDILIAKYDSLGALQWWDQIDNGQDDIGNAISLNPINGDVYIAGISYNSSTSSNDYFLAKYDVNGNQVWTDWFDGSGNDEDTAKVIKLDIANNVLYVTGTSKNSSGYTDIVTCQFSMGSGINWSHSYDGSGNTDDYAMDMVIDGGGNYIYVAGIESSSSSLDMTTFCIDNSGSFQWNRVVDGTANATDGASAIVLSGANVVVCGTTRNSTRNDYQIDKYDCSSGSVVWSNTYDFTGNDDYATDLVKDTLGNIAVTGIATNGSSFFEYHTVLFDSVGTQIWANQEPIGLSSVNANPHIAMDTLANFFYVAGERQNINNDVFLFQIRNDDGHTEWRKSFNGQNNGFDCAVDISVTGWGNIYLAANCESTVSAYNLTTIKYSQTPAYFAPDTTCTNDKSFLFYENLGQVLNDSLNPVSKIKYVTNTSPKYFITENTLSMVFAGSARDSIGVDTIHRIDMNFHKSNPLTEIYSFEEDAAEVQYILGHLPNVKKQHGYQRLMIPNLYPGIDLQYYSNNQGGLKYYYILKPYISSNSIEQVFSSSNYTTQITGGGGLRIISSVGEMTLERPVVYQLGMMLQTIPVGTGTWVSSGTNSYTIALPSYTTSLPLFIMVNQKSQQQTLSTVSTGNLKWSTFLGGGDDDQSWAITVDGLGNQHVAGATMSINFPTFGGQIIQSSQIFTGNRYGFYSKFNPQHQQLLTVYIGGNDQTDAYDVKTNSSNEAYIVGTTQATNFAYKKKTGAYNDTLIGSTATNAREDAFIVKFNASNQYVWGTYFGGTNNDGALSCAFDASDNLYVVGHMRSVAMPLVGSGSAYQHVWNGSDDAFISKFNTSDNLTWYTYYGGSSYETAYSCKVDGSGNLFVTGATYGGAFPTYTASSSYYIDSTFAGSADVFILKFNSSGTRQWSTLFGGSGYDGSLYYPTHKGIVFDASNNIYITDNSSSTDLTTKRLNSTCYYDSTFGGNIDGFIAKFSSGLGLQYCTYVGGSGYDYAHAIGLDNSSNVYVSYGTNSSSIPTNAGGSGYIQTSPYSAGFTPTYAQDNFLLSLNSSLVSRWATYYGGTSYNNQGDEGTEIAIKGSDMYLTGYCNSYVATPGSDVRFPIFYPGSPAYIDSTYNDNTQANTADGFISEFDLSAIVGIEEFSLNKDNFDFALYPNPANNIINVKINAIKQEKLKLAILSIDGKIVMETYYPVLEGVNLIQLNCHNLVPGMYLISFKGQDFSATQKFIKD